MPISALPKRNTSAAPQPRRLHHLGPILALIVIGVLTVAVIAAPASIVQRLLPEPVHAEDFSGSLWHGSAGRVLVNSHDLGAIEWHLHPWPLLRLALAADLHWVKIGFVADAGITVDRRGAAARNVVGGGPIEDLYDLGVAAGWRGTTQFNFSELTFGFPDDAGKGGAVRLSSVVGDLGLSALSSPQIAGGTDLGGYALHLADAAITEGTDATAQLTDTGGPLEVRAAVHYSVKQHTGLLSGTVRERAGASPALRNQLELLTQMHARDSEGRIPVELEFTL